MKGTIVQLVLLGIYNAGCIFCIVLWRIKPDYIYGLPNYEQSGLYAGFLFLVILSFCPGYATIIYFFYKLIWMIKNGWDIGKWDIKCETEHRASMAAKARENGYSEDEINKLLG